MSCVNLLDTLLTDGIQKLDATRPTRGFYLPHVASTICPMITYDEAKRRANISTHRIDFVGCEAVFDGFTLTREDRREPYGETRFQTLGLWNGVVVFVVHTPRGEDDHIISIRKAEKHEERIYWQARTP